MVQKKYVIALIAVIALAGYVKLSNPYRKYSTQQFWATATVETAREIPVAALRPGNKNGSVLMWAAMGTANPEIIRLLIERGANVNEADIVFGGTPLSGAAGYGQSPLVIAELVKNGANIAQRVHHNETVLMIAAQFNERPEIIEELYKQGAKLSDVDIHGNTALHFARHKNNRRAIEVLERLAAREVDSSAAPGGSETPSYQ